MRARIPLLLYVVMGTACGAASGDVPPATVDIAGAPSSSREAPAAVAVGEEDEEGDKPKRFGAESGRDRDGDGRVGADDQCPDAPEDRDGFEDSDGCPDPDNDGDGIADVNDRCPNEPETIDGQADDDGCPDDPRIIAKNIFKRAVIALNAGDYAAARAGFEEAYRTLPADAVLYNIAMVAKLQGDRAGACKVYRQWRSSPQGAQGNKSIPELETCP